ncbi:HlyD family secretion protein [Elioraea thermophila]|uniref:HlyD family secretion protein n=1 Tax=Elioraea thermophila TaxID=2185104 RepID=UPI000DF3C9CA|nr:HlyD family secretion protein [Elioraea thermophila]
MLARRFSRILLGVGLLGAAAAAGLPHLTHRISTAAVVNADLVRLSAPIAGVADAALPQPGTVLPAGTEVVLVHRLVPEERERFRLAQELESVRAQIDRLNETLAVLAAHEREVTERGRKLVAAAEQVLLRERAEAAAARHAARARASQAAVELAHAEEMHRRGLFAAPRVEAARAALAAAESEEEALTARIARIEAQIGALAIGVHLRDGYNDVPYSVQQRDRILIMREAALDRLAEAQARERVLVAALAVEEEAARRRAAFSQRIETPMLVWQRHVAPGAPVGAGETLLDLVRCDRLFVEVSLPDRAFAAVGPGETARVRLPGGLALEGGVTALRGAGARASRSLAAAELPGEPGARLTVRVALPADAAERLAHPSDGSFCGIGRLAEVSFPAGPGWNPAELALALWRRGSDLVSSLAKSLTPPAAAEPASGP